MVYAIQSEWFFSCFFGLNYDRLVLLVTGVCWNIFHCIQVSRAGLSALILIVSKLVLPEGNRFPSTSHLFHQFFEDAVPKQWKRIVICVKEHHIFEDGEVVCPKCGEQRNRTLYLTYGDKEIPRKWFYSVDFVELVKHRFAKDPAWVKVRQFRFCCCFRSIVCFVWGFFFFSFFFSIIHILVVLVFY